MATKNSGYFPAPGAQNPSRYPAVGPNYIKYGEQPGWAYSPRDDKYYRDQTYRENLTKYEQEAGLREKPPEPPKQQGLGDIVLPVAATAGTVALSQGLGGKLIDTLSTLGKTGEATSQLGNVANTANAAQVPQQIGGTLPVTSAGPQGLFSAGSVPTGFNEASQAAWNAPASASAPAGAPVGAEAASSTLGSVVPVAGAALGTYLAGRAGMNMLQGKENKSVPDKIGRAQLAITTGGLSEIANRMGLLGHKSTRQVAKDHTNDLLKQAPEDQQWQGYVSGMREQYNSAPSDPSKPFAGKYANFEEYKQAGLEAADLTGVYGNLKVYGPEWAKLSQDQRQAVTQLNINDGLYQSKKGEVEITNADKAKQNLATVVSQQNKGPAPLQPGQTPASTAGAASGLLSAMPQRSKTSSPGIDKNGKRIKY